MKPYAIVSEGPDDVAALRALLANEGGIARGPIYDAHRNPLVVTLAGAPIAVWSAQGKQKARRSERSTPRAGPRATGRR